MDIKDPNGPVGVVIEVAARSILKHEGFDTGGYPGGASGNTIGRGYDLGYHTAEQFTADWKALLSREDFARLLRCIGLKGQAARERAVAIKGRITSLTREDADAVFRNVDLPRWEREARTAFDGFDTLPELAEGALVSLVFNRGPRTKDRDRIVQERREMRAIQNAVARYAIELEAGHLDTCRELLAEIAAQIRAMKRLWIGKGLDGLLRRRDDEAALVLSAIT